MNDSSGLSNKLACQEDIQEKTPGAYLHDVRNGKNQ